LGATELCAGETTMLGVDIVGYVAAALVLVAFCMQSMCTLRVFAILSNLAFITYAYHRDLVPILLLHVILLPVNAARLYQLFHPEPSKL
jgi:CRP/FNR family transcriptional regulator, cyclic AMP receptor protein